MSKPLTQQLFQLIKSLSKAEKRHFRLYATRNSAEKELKFLSVFSVLDTQQEYDEAQLLKKVEGLSKRQLSNLKAHLYQQILVSLRLLHRKHEDLQLRELLDFATVLYEKGLYLQSLDQLAKARTLARQRHRQRILVEIIAFEKRIEIRHITRSHAQRAQELIEWGTANRNMVLADESWSDLALEMYGLYLRIGHVKNHEEHAYVEAYFRQRLPETSGDLSFFGKIYQVQAHVWYYYTLQDWKRCYRFAKAWVDLFEEHPQFQALELELFIKGLHNLLSTLYYLMDGPRFQKYYKRMQQVLEEHEGQLNESTRIHSLIYQEMARTNLYFLNADFEAGVAAIPDMEARLLPYQDRIDEHRILLFWYKFACLYFARGDHRSCIQYLQRIVNHPKMSLREDIQVFARILKLIAHYELGDHDHVDAQIRSTYRYLLKAENMQQVQKAVMNFLKQSVYMDRHDIIPHFRQLQARLEEIAENPYERRPFLYLDLYTYLRTKIEGLPMAEAVRLRVSEKRY